MNRGHKIRINWRFFDAAGPIRSGLQIKKPRNFRDLIKFHYSRLEIEGQPQLPRRSIRLGDDYSRLEIGASCALSVSHYLQRKYYGSM